ncbi:ABC transporter permease [Abyssalbus ytuae]|uniref:ABC transporter permease n=1 Tax=Abyssalbus ytuae TaxID=2926907 RepID=A0A9E6ZM32_9FLAO|nr:ABC transporter permease [Abyssalbus ytuae]UOB18314.1 ABC transporter permease [Abyssalbus ytuae]
MNHLFLVVKREYFVKVRNKSFILMTFLSPLIFLGLFSLVAYLSQLNKNQIKTISILDESSQFSGEFQNDVYTNYQYLENVTLDDAKKLVKEGDVYGLLYFPALPPDDLAENIQFFSKESPSLHVIEGLTKKIEKRLFNLNLDENGVDVSIIDRARVYVDISLEDFAGEKTSRLTNVLKLIFGGSAGYLLMMFIIIYGNMIMRSVIEEKTNRIIEIIISSVKPVQLMLGKIIGTSLAGITQFLIWTFVGFILITVVSLIFGIDVAQMKAEQGEMMMHTVASSKMEGMVTTGLMELYKLPLGTIIICFIIYFIGGYLLYSSFYAAIGAAVDNETDTQQFMLPVIMPLMLAIYVGIFTVIDDPHGTVSTLFSYIPLTSPIVMLMRIPFGVSWWEITLSVLLLYATFMGTVWFASKIYRVGILMYGKKPTYKELYKWLKY